MAYSTNIPTLPDESLLLAALMTPELWTQFWAERTLLTEAVLLNDPEGNVWSIEDLEVVGDGTLRVVTRTGGERTTFVVSIEKED